MESAPAYVPSMSEIHAVENQLVKAIAAKQLTDEGVRWLYGAMCPGDCTTVDFSIPNKDGYERYYGFKQKVATAITAPLSFGPDGEFEFRVDVTNLICSNEGVQCAASILSRNDINLGFPGGDPDVLFPVGMVNICYKSPTDAEFSYADTNTQVLGLDPQFLAGEVEMTSIEVKLVNYTQTLTKGGGINDSVTNEPRDPFGNYQIVFNTTEPPYQNAATEANLAAVRAPPVNLTEMRKNPNMITRSATQGTVLVCPTYPSVQSKTQNGLGFTWLNGTPNASNYSASIFGTTTMPVSQTWSGNTSVTFAQRDWMGFNPCQTKCTIVTGQDIATANWQIEVTFIGSVRPNTDNILMLNSSREAPEFDYKACAIGTKVFSHLPVSVPAKENDLGTLLKRGVGLIGKFLPSIVGMIGGPGPAAIAQVLSSGAEYLFSKDEQKAKKAKKQLKKDLQKEEVAAAVHQLARKGQLKAPAPAPSPPPAAAKAAAKVAALRQASPKKAAAPAQRSRVVKTVEIPRKNREPGYSDFSKALLMGYNAQQMSSFGMSPAVIAQVEAHRKAEAFDRANSVHRNSPDFPGNAKLLKRKPTI